MNKRCLINGPAGTGKTVLAIKNVKESVALGKKVGFFCFNMLLEKELKRHFDNLEETKPLYIGSLTNYLEQLVRKYDLYDFNKMDNPSVFYKKELPLLALDAITIEGVKFDKIVIDEAQDLMTDEYLMVIDVLLNGGLKKGEWFFFGDFDFQTINNREISGEKVVELLEDNANFAIFNLTINCRNTPNIQKEMNKVFGTNTQSLNKDDNMPEVEYINFVEQADEAVLLENKIKELIKKGVKPSEITILSAYKYDKSVASRINDKK